MKFFTNSRHRDWAIPSFALSICVSKRSKPTDHGQARRTYFHLALSGQVAYRLTVDRQLGYLFERFPAFTQTFCARELAELYRQGTTPPIFSVRRPAEDRPSNVGLERLSVYYLPDTNSLKFKIRTKLISPRLRGLWSGSGDIRDKTRFREAVYLGSKLRKVRISHLHVHFAGLASRTAFWIKRLFGITYSFTGHANDIFCPKPDQRVTLSDLIREASFIVTVSDFSANRLRNDFPEASDKVYRIYNGLDLSTFKAAAPGSNPVRLLSVGRLIEKKGFIFLVEACRLLRASGIQFVCEIVGEGPERGRLEELIKVYQLSDRVRLPGSLPQTKIVELLARSSIFVFPAIHDRSGDSDNLPTVIIEAMASSLPVIATEIAGIPEIVRHNENGILVQEKDATQLANAVRVLAFNQSLLEKYGGASRTIAAEKFALSQTVGELKNLFSRFNLVS